MSHFSRLLEIMLPHGGFSLPLVEAYFDESGSHDSSPVLCVAGFIIESEAAKRMDEEWEEMLQQYSLPFFHMADCAHGVKPFNLLDKNARIAAETRAIAIMREHITQCIVMSVIPEVFDRVVPSSPLLGSVYSLCVHNCLAAVQSWADKYTYRGDIAYIFESGHRSQSEANGIMNMIFSSDDLRKKHRYLSHMFADKRKLMPLQAADIIAWLWHSDCKRKMALGGSKPRRLDLKALMQPKSDGSLFFAGLHMDANFLRTISKPIMRNEYPLTYVERPN